MPIDKTLIYTEYQPKRAELRFKGLGRNGAFLTERGRPHLDWVGYFLHKRYFVYSFSNRCFDLILKRPTISPLRHRETEIIFIFNLDALAETQRMAKQKVRPTRPGGFSGAKAYIRYVEVLKKRRNAVGRTFCDAIIFLVPL
jgi:hypothetical protein